MQYAEAALKDIAMFKKMALQFSMSIYLVFFSLAP
jgi:hypothetical protein